MRCATFTHLQHVNFAAIADSHRLEWQILPQGYKLIQKTDKIAPLKNKRPCTVTTKPKKISAKGESTRQKILAAALEVIATSGLRAVTHRSVAAAAGVQLSLTTYYFKDLNELLIEAFTSFCNAGRPGYEKTWEKVNAAAAQVDRKSLKSRAGQEQLAEALAEIGTDHILRNIRTRPMELAVEQQLLNELRLTPELAKVAEEYMEKLIEPLRTMVLELGSTAPETDAQLLMSVMLKLEHDGLANPRSRKLKGQVFTLLQRQIRWVLAGL